MKRLCLLLLPLAAAGPSFGALALCAVNVNFITNAQAVSPLSVNCPGIVAAQGYGIEQLAIRGLASMQTTIEGQVGTAAVTLTPQGAGSAISPVTLNLAINNNFTASSGVQLGPITNLTLAVATIAGFTVDIGTTTTGDIADTGSVTVWLFYEVTANGTTQANPILPTSGNGNTWTFTNGNSGFWYDPPLVDTYDYVAAPGTTFTGITLPTGFASAFQVFDGVTFVGSFAGGTTVNFGSPTTAFRVAGINPLVDAASPTAFPLQIFFSGATGSFTQTGIEAVPEPSSIGLAMSALVLAVWRRRSARARD